MAGVRHVDVSPPFSLSNRNLNNNRALELVFARSVPAAKVVDALASIGGVKESVLQDFSATLLKAIGTSIGKGETVTLAWTSDDKLALQVLSVRRAVYYCLWQEGLWRFFLALSWRLPSNGNGNTHYAMTPPTTGARQGGQDVCEPRAGQGHLRPLPRPQGKCGQPATALWVCEVSRS